MQQIHSKLTDRALSIMIFDNTQSHFSITAIMAGFESKSLTPKLPRLRRIVGVVVVVAIIVIVAFAV